MAIGPMLRSRNFTAVPCADQINEAAASKVKYQSILPFPAVLCSSVVVDMIRFSVAGYRLPRSGRPMRSPEHLDLLEGLVLGLRRNDGSAAHRQPSCESRGDEKIEIGGINSRC